MKVQIPQELKADVPQTTFGKILSATPVVMAVVATMLAGLASSEMTRAQYDRSLAAQQQSKAGDQWSFFQAKRLRGAFQQNSSELLQSLIELHPLDLNAVRRAAEQPLPAALAPERQAEVAKVKTELQTLLASAAAQPALACLEKGTAPAASAAGETDPKLKAALETLENLGTDAEMAAALAPVTVSGLEEALRAARDRTQAFDATTKPVNQGIDRLGDLLARLAGGLRQTSAADANLALSRDFAAARLRYHAQRYETEARLNQSIANIYELQVRKSNISAEHHHTRSQRFFFGMLGAQLGVIIATFAMAARQRNLLWALAAGAGLLAIAFAIYVYLYV
jgi:hypothetical protein